MKTKETLHSQLDKSVNIIFHKGKSLVEARLVQRCEEQVIVYVSSHNGCKMACRFCHLTQTGQTEMEEVSVDEFLQQIDSVCALKSDMSNVKRVNINFMARGEPLLNKHVFSQELYDKVLERFKGIDVKFNVSSIIPDSVNSLPYHENMRFYYSLYSIKDEFRKRWLPKAKCYRKSLELLKSFKGEVIIHGAFIEGHNDSEPDVNEMINTIVDSGVKCRFNIVAYNPFGENQGRESPRLKEISEQIGKLLSVQEVPRVGFDVNASCGMFV